MKMDQLPKDPIMLLSYVNTMLRDNYDSLDELCRSLDIDKEELIDRLSVIPAEYIAAVNQFRQA